MNPKDTVQAMVKYGDTYLLEDYTHLAKDRLHEVYDSLSRVEEPPESFLWQLRLYLDIPTMSKNQIVSTVDSLFSLDTIPYPLINQINWYVTSTGEKAGKEFIEESALGIDYYSDWNTKLPNPYNSWKSVLPDSSLELQLITHFDTGFTLPHSGKLTSRFGWRDGRNHNGIDIDLQVWDTVKTAFSGVVRFANWYGSYGRVVVVRHFNGLETTYAHLHRIKVASGDTITSGVTIGLGGSSGRSTGSHLHWEVRFKGVPINPLAIINLKSRSLIHERIHLKEGAGGLVALPEGVKHHTVKRGDFLYRIAKNYGTSVTKLCELNQINRNTPLRVGQKLRII